jgi:ferric iron reductase protein FhuF
MTTNWADAQRSNKFCSPRAEEQRTITIIQDLLDKAIDSESAAQQIATTYEPRLLEGEKISYQLFSLISQAIVHPVTTLENHQHISEMLLHLSKLPDVIVDGLPCMENGRTYWHTIPEFSFWFSEHALR